MPLETDIMQTMVSRCHSLLRALFFQPPQRSTTTSPSMLALTADPTSSSLR